MCLGSRPVAKSGDTVLGLPGWATAIEAYNIVDCCLLAGLVQYGMKAPTWLKKLFTDRVMIR